MSLDTIAQILVQVGFAATILLVARLYWVGFQHRYPLFVLWTALSAIFTLPELFPKLPLFAEAGIVMVSFMMDLFLLPFVALELFRPDPEKEYPPARYAAPPLAGLLAAACLAAYLSTGLDRDSFSTTYQVMLMLETIVSMVVAGYLIRKFRTGTPPGEPNVMWMRRLFFLTLVLNVVELFTIGVSEDDGTNRILRVGALTLDLFIPVASLIVLRKGKPQGAPVAE